MRRSPKPGLDGRGPDYVAELVDDERRHRLTIDVLSDDQHGLPLLDGLLEGGSMMVDEPVDDRQGVSHATAHIEGQRDLVTRS